MSYVMVKRPRRLKPKTWLLRHQERQAKKATQLVAHREAVREATPRTPNEMAQAEKVAEWLALSPSQREERRARYRAQVKYRLENDKEQQR